MKGYSVDLCRCVRATQSTMVMLGHDVLATGESLVVADTTLYTMKKDVPASPLGAHGCSARYVVEPGRWCGGRRGKQTSHPAFANRRHLPRHGALRRVRFTSAFRCRLPDTPWGAARRGESVHTAGVLALYTGIQAVPSAPVVPDVGVSASYSCGAKTALAKATSAGATWSGTSACG